MTENAGDYYPITGRKTTGGVFDRIPVEELQATQPYQWSLFILGYAWIKDTPIPFPGVAQPQLKAAESLMEVGGIHGRPYREYAGDHRTSAEAKADYSLTDKKDTDPVPSRLLQQAIGEYADNIAQQIENMYPQEAGLWVNAAKQLRFPYWDWADPKAETSGFPSLFYDDQLSITAPGSKTVSVPNPLAFFKFPYIPEDFQDITRNGVTAYFTKWPQTYRHAANSPNPPGTNIDDLQAYDEFSNTLNESRREMDYSNMGSLEGVHNSIHGAIGGNGHMGNPDYAGFDPFFYFALWEWCYTDYWMNEGYTHDGQSYPWTQARGTYSQVYNAALEPTGENGLLVPFRNEDGSYWTNEQTRFLTPNVYPKYYSYKEFLGIKVDIAASSPQERDEARARIAKYYSVDPQAAAGAHAGTGAPPPLAHVPVPGVGEVDLPTNFKSIRGFRLFLVLVRLPEHAFGRSYNFQVFYKENQLVGNVTVFTREDNSPCKACAFRRDNGAVVRGVISLQPSLVNEIIVNSGIDRSKNTMEITTGLITKALSGKLLDLSGRVLASASGGEDVAAVPAGNAATQRVQPVEISLLSSAVAEHADDKNKPVYFFDWKPHNSLFPSGWKAESQEAAH
ncbi:hypothetical protein HYDPIDRAFT_169156 [Hydnomerulius pinastri MD-312]|uniref:Tyrosinase copper-binding domain-containing protein n=1 Tax=Hydnomerulius pinastri MD-312 TaxID=994086 RepID=A0A0C9VWG7_9AGAM|nr:hypothetical protein HYDPIDRAFT_169156 [Hydnomerulius pinastri MD-312]